MNNIEDKLVNLDVIQLGAYFRDVSSSWSFRIPVSYKRHQLRKGCGGARGDDAANLKSVVVSWVGTLFDPSHAHPALSPTNKTCRGLEHDITGKLLCPIDYNWEDAK